MILSIAPARLPLFFLVIFSSEHFVLCVALLLDVCCVVA
jgi:hypothetical protein